MVRRRPEDTWGTRQVGPGGNILLQRWRQWRRERLLERHALPKAVVAEIYGQLPILAALDAAERQRLVELATLFLADKRVMGAGGLEPDLGMAVTVALQACLPILNLDLDWYSGFTTIILYPGDFVARHRYQDELGLEHLDEQPMVGEAWEGGPVVLSWADVAQSGELDGFNVVIHEFAHKLDMCNGDANGHPPLHTGMDRQAWTLAFSAAYEDLCEVLESGDEPPLDPYAAESPAEFFSVLSEAFFELPDRLAEAYPEVYRQLVLFYRQDPWQRLQQRA